MRELSKRLMVTGGNVTGITDQLEAEGLVLRETRADDRRSFIVRLTPQGRRQFKRMAATHEGWIVELFAGWTPAQKSQVHELLAQLKTHLKDNT
jgi:DNA-binding MarR family transcriptional regulator